MGRKQGRPKAGKEALSRDRILSTALRLVDEQGMEALSMRRLAAELNVDPMAIYHYLPNKQALIDGFVELVFSKLNVSLEPGVDWQMSVRAVAHAYHDLAKAHPNLVFYLTTDTSSVTAAVLEANEVLYAALMAAQLPTAMIIRAADLIVDYVNGFALAEIVGPLGQPDEPKHILAQLDKHPPASFPTLRQVYDNLTPADLSGNLEDGLSIILAGIEAIREKS